MSSIKIANNIYNISFFFVCDKVFYSITAREIILGWDKTACRFVFSHWTWTCLFEEDLDSDLDLPA